MVNFLDSCEVVAWNVQPWKEMWRAKLRTRIGSTAYHESAAKLLVWNLLDGVDIYRLTDQPTSHLVFVRKLRVKIRRNQINRVQFDVSGTKAICGGDNGEVSVWDIENGELIQTLPHGEELHAVQVITYHSPQTTKHYIASGSSGQMQDAKSHLKVWIIDRHHRENTSNNKQASVQGKRRPSCSFDGVIIVSLAFVVMVVLLFYQG